VSIRLVQAILLVEDLELASADLRELGLDVRDGGRHPGRGTANRIVPFGEQYLELLAVVDPHEAKASPLGRPVLAALRKRGPGLARWSVQAEDIDTVEARVGLAVQRRARTLPDGTTTSWRAVAVDEAWAEPWRCAFMAWDDPLTHPARMSHQHDCGATGIAWIEIGVPDEAALIDWLGGPTPTGLRLLVGAEPGPRRLAISTPAGELVLS
jgi:Glyoxalase-like domain